MQADRPQQQTGRTSRASTRRAIDCGPLQSGFLVWRKYRQGDP